MRTHLLEFWKLCTDFSVVQTALIICGEAPDDLQSQVENSSKVPVGYLAVRTALVNGIVNGRIEARVCHHQDDYGTRMDVHETTIHVSEIIRFLKASGRHCPFFFSLAGVGDPGNESDLPPKLDAALKAWRAVSSDPARLRGKSPKQALEQWLLENAGDLALLNRDGEPNRTGIEEICKVANWKPAGGATPTPAALPPPSLSSAIESAWPARQQSREPFDIDFDDEIPF